MRKTFLRKACVQILEVDLAFASTVFCLLVPDSVQSRVNTQLLVTVHRIAQQDILTVRVFFYCASTCKKTMSGLKNSPFGKRLRASQQDSEETSRRRKQRLHPTFGFSTPSLDSRTHTSDSSTGPETPADISIPTSRPSNREYGDRFVPSRDVGDMRTSYHLIDEAGPSTPSKNRTIPSESDALKGTSCRSSSFVSPFILLQNKLMQYSTPSYTLKSPLLLLADHTPLHDPFLYHPMVPHLPLNDAAFLPTTRLQHPTQARRPDVLIPQQMKLIP